MGAACAVLRLRQPVQGIDGRIHHHLVCTERTLAIRLHLAECNGEPFGLFRDALAALRAAQHTPRGPSV